MHTMSYYRLAAAGKSKVKAVCAAPGLAATNLQVCLKDCCCMCVRILVPLLYMCPHTTPNAWLGRDEYASDDGGGWRLGERMVHKVC
jgi:hypothetical protein